jgi:hypothetical protein
MWGGVLVMEEREKEEGRTTENALRRIGEKEGWP